MIKILFLEDEPNILEVTTEYMKMQGYDVTCVCNGEEALKILVPFFSAAIILILKPIEMIEIVTP